MFGDMSTGDLERELHNRKVAENKAKARYEITGVWGGYNESQSRVVHLEYTTNKKLVESIEKLGFIRYTDGTILHLSIRQLEFRERKKAENKTYSRLIRQCISQETNNVANLKG